MASAQKTFLLPCTCSHEIEIVSGQAGGTTACPACGSRIDVPKLRDFSGLRTKAAEEDPRGRRWGTAHAVAVAGAALAALAWGGAAVVGSLPKAAFSADVIRADIHAENDLVLYKALGDMAETSVARMPMREEFELQRRARFAFGMSRALVTLGSLGAVMAAGAGLALLAGRKRA